MISSYARTLDVLFLASLLAAILQDTLYEGSISRDQVAEVAVEALLHPESNYKVVEIVSRSEAPKRSFEELFGSIKND